jgi:hypothetical protein
MNSYFALLEELPDYQKIKLQFMEYLQDDTPTNDEDRKFEELCNNYMISTTEPTEYGEYESVSYNFYALNKNQSDLFREVTKLQKNILESVVGEIKPI